MEVYRDSALTMALDLAGATNISAVVKRDGIQVFQTTGDPFNLPLSVTAQEGQVVVDWTFDYAGEVGIHRTESFDVVTPYASIEELKGVNATLSALPDSELTFLEQTIRNVINAFTGQSFGNRYKTITMSVEDGMPFILPERTWQIDSITTSFDPTTNIFGTSYVLGPDGYSIAPYRDSFYHVWDFENIIVTGPIEAPSIFPYNRDYTITVTGWFGWESVPSDINWAAKKLAVTYTDNDNAYREKMVKAVTAQTWQLEYQDNSESTGNVDVDRILSSYFIPRMEVI